MQDLVYNVTRGHEGLHEQHWTDQYTEKIRSWYLLHPAYGNPDWGGLSDIWTAVKWRDDNIEDCLTEQFMIFVADTIDHQEGKLSSMHEM